MDIYNNIIKENDIKDINEQKYFEIQIDANNDILEDNSEDMDYMLQSGGTYKNKNVSENNNNSGVNEDKDDDPNNIGLVILEENDKEIVSEEENDEEIVSEEENDKEIVSEEENDEEIVSEEENDEEIVSEEENDKEIVSEEENDKEIVSEEENDKEIVSEEENDEEIVSEDEDNNDNNSDMENLDDLDDDEHFEMIGELDEKNKTGIDVNEIISDAEAYDKIIEISEIQFKNEDERIYSDVEEIEDMIKELVDKLHIKKRENPLILEKIRNYVEILNLLKIEYTKFDLNNEPIGIKDIDNRRPLVNLYKDYNFTKDWLKPIVANKNKIYSANEDANYEDNETFFRIGQTKEVELYNEILLNYKQNTITYRNLLTSLYELTRPYHSSPNPIGHIFHSNKSILVQRYCDPENYSCETWSEVGLKSIQSNTVKILDPEFIYSERKLERGNSTKINTVINDKEIVIRGDECNLQGLIQYPKNKIKNYDMYDGVYPIGKIVSESKKKPIIINQLYKNEKENYNLKIDNINLGNYEIGMDVLISNPNFMIAELSDRKVIVELIGKIKVIDGEKIIIGMPDNPNAYTKMLFDQISNNEGEPSMMFNKKETVLYNEEDKTELKNQNEKGIHLMYPDNSILSGIIDNVNYIDFLERCIPQTYTLLINLNDRDSFVQNLSDIDKILYPYGIDFNKINDIDFDYLKELININIEILLDFEKDNNKNYELYKKTRIANQYILKKKILRKDFIVTNELIEIFYNLGYSHYWYLGNYYDSDCLRYRWITSQVDNGMLYMYNLLIDKEQTKTQAQKEKSIKATIKQIDEKIVQKTQKYDEKSELEKYFKKKEICKKYVLSKIYTDINQLKEDNNKSDLNFDLSLDDTPVYLLNEIKVENPNIDIALIKPLLIDKLTKMNFFDTEEEKDYIIENILHGGKIVENGDYALLKKQNEFEVYVRKTFKHEANKQIWSLEKPSIYQKIIRDNKDLCDQNGLSLEELSVDQFVSKDSCQYKEEKQDTFYDKSGKPVMYNISERSSDRNKDKTFKINTKDIGKCLPRKLFRLEKEISDLVDVKKYNENLLKNIENFDKELEILMIKRDKIEKYINLTKLYNEQIIREKFKKKEYYKSNYKDINYKCQHLALVKKAYKTENEEQRISLLCKALDKYRKGYHTDGENVNYIYCNKCNLKLMCHHELKIMDRDISRDNGVHFTKMLIKEYGVIDDLGIMCKYCGKYLQRLEADEFEGFIDGMPIMTREQLLQDSNKGILTINDILSEDDIGEGNKILEIIDKFLKLLRIENVLDNNEKVILVKEILNEIKTNIDEKYKSKIEKNPDKITNYLIGNRILSTVSILFIKLQVLKETNVILRYSFNKCIASLAGFPLNNDENQKTGIKYISCVLSSLSNNEPWDAVLNFIHDYLSITKGKNFKKTQIASKLEGFIIINITEKLKKLSKQQNYLELLIQKRKYITQLESTKNIDSVWSNFLPPLNMDKSTPYVSEINLGQMDDLYSNILKGDVKLYNLLDIVSLLKKEINNASYEILYKLNENINEENITTPLFGLNMLTTSCCISPIKKSFEYLEYFHNKSIMEKVAYINNLQYFLDKFVISNYEKLIHCDNTDISKYTVDDTFIKVYPCKFDYTLILNFYLTYCNLGFTRGEKHMFNSKDCCILCFETKNNIKEELQANKSTIDIDFKKLLLDIEQNNILRIRFNYSIENILELLDILSISETNYKEGILLLREQIEGVFQTWKAKNVTEQTKNLTNIWDKFTNSIEQVKQDISTHLESVLEVKEYENIGRLINTICEMQNKEEDEDITINKINGYKYTIIPILRYIIAKISNSKLTISVFNENIKLPGNNQAKANILSTINTFIKSKNEKIENLFVINNDGSSLLSNKKYKGLLDKIIEILDINFSNILKINGINDKKIDGKTIEKSLFSNIYALYLIQYIFLSTILEILKIPDTYFFKQPEAPDMDALEELNLKNDSYNRICNLLEVSLRIIKNDINRTDFTKNKRIEQLEKQREVEKVKVIADVEELKKRDEEYKAWVAMKNLGLKSLYRDVEDDGRVFMEIEQDFVNEKHEEEKKELGELDFNNEEDPHTIEAADISNDHGEDGDYDLD